MKPEFHTNIKQNRNNNNRIKARAHRERNLQYGSHELQKRSRAIQSLRKQTQKANNNRNNSNWRQKKNKLMKEKTREKDLEKCKLKKYWMDIFIPSRIKSKGSMGMRWEEKRRKKWRWLCYLILRKIEVGIIQYHHLQYEYDYRVGLLLLLSLKSYLTSLFYFILFFFLISFSLCGFCFETS